jgi:predicted DNA-binding protein
MDFDMTAKVLEPKPGWISTSFCGLGKGRKEIISDIVSGSGFSRIEVSFGLGKILSIVPETTWGDVYAYLDQAKLKREYSLDFPPKLTELIKEMAAESGKTEKQIVQRALERFCIKTDETQAETEKKYVEVELDLGEDLADRLKKEAARTGKTVDEIVEEAIRKALAN